MVCVKMAAAFEIVIQSILEETWYLQNIQLRKK